MRLRRLAPRRPQDPAIALINIVFLMLIFFLLAGTVAPVGGRDIELIQTSAAQNDRPPAQPIYVTAAGEIRYGGTAMALPLLLQHLAETAAAASESYPAEAVEIVADRHLPAPRLISIVQELQRHGFRSEIVTRGGVDEASSR
jgi:biopolymer transport protein ExbD